MKKLIYVTPHLSTGGAPQYLLKKIELLKDDFDIYLVEYRDIGGTAYIVQKNLIFDIIPSHKRLTLNEDKNELIAFIRQVQPDIVHLEEIPELFMDVNVAEKLYSSDRKYLLFETSHDSSQNPKNKRFFPDKFLFVSNWQIDQYRELDIPSVLVEYPIEYKDTRDRVQACKVLGLDPTKKHIINVGLFTSRKNQAEFFEYAKALPEFEFHCIGNQAENFKSYWEPLMENKPENMTVWGERNDVDNFYQAADLFLFTSKGNSNDKETMPLVIREALSWKLPILIYNLDVYQNYFDRYPVNYLTNFEENLLSITKLVSKTDAEVDIKDEEVFVVSTYPNSKAIEDTTLECIRSIKKIGKKVILTSHYPVPTSLQEEADYCIYDSKNILVKHTYFKYAWYELSEIKFEFQLEHEDNDWYHGPAVYSNYYNGSQLAEKLGFKKVYFVNFDYILKNNKFIQNCSTNLSKFDAYLLKENNQEGSTYSTWFMGFNTSFYNKLFPKIETGQEYNEWTTAVGSPSNGLEKSMYCALKERGNYSYIKTEEIDAAFDFKSFSQVEYLTLLPSNKEGTVLATAQFSDSVNSKKLIIEVKDLENNILSSDTFNVTGKGVSWVEIDTNLISSTFGVEFTVIDVEYNSIVKRKRIKVDKEYLTSKIFNNGNAFFKNLPG